MRLIRLATFLAVVVATATLSTNKAKAVPAFIGPPPVVSPVQAVTAASTIVVGKVVAIEKDPVEVAGYQGAPKEQAKVPYKIAKIKISESLLGAKGLTEIKVGFSAFAEAGGGRPAIDLPIRRPRPGLVPPVVALTEGQEGTFMLTRHFEGDFYVLAGGPNSPPLDKKAADYDKKLAEIKKVVGVMKDPIASLKSKEKDDRGVALEILTAKYRNWNKPTPPVEENVPAEEATLIIDAILELPWTPKPGAANPYDPKTLSNYFGVWLSNEQARLKFSYPPIKPGETQETINKNYEEAVVKFIKENRDKLTLKRYTEKK